MGSYPESSRGDYSAVNVKQSDSRKNSPLKDPEVTLRNHFS